MPVPQITGINPQAVTVGSPDTTVTLTGQNFSAATTVSWNNNALATTFVNNSQMQATIPAAALGTPAAAPFYVENSPREGISNVVAFSVLANLGASTQLTALNLSGTDLVWNAATKLLYVGASNLDSLNPDTIVTIDPVAVPSSRPQRPAEIHSCWQSRPMTNTSTQAFHTTPMCRDTGCLVFHRTFSYHSASGIRRPAAHLEASQVATLPSPWVFRRRSTPVSA